MRMANAFMLLAVASGMAIASSASAAILWDGLGATDSVSMAQFGPELSFVSSGTAFTSTGGITGTVTTSAGADMQRFDQGSDWNGNFAPGAPLLYNRHAANDIIFTFDTAVSGVGAQFQPPYLGPFTARIILDDNSFFDVAGNSTSAGDNSAIFIGVRNEIANITGIHFRQQVGVGNNEFAIGSLSLMTGGVVPEPATWAMFILGFGLVGSTLRRTRDHARNCALPA